MASTSSREYLPLEQARAQGIKVLVRVRDGEYPAGDRKGPRATPTIEDLGPRVVEDHAVHHCRPSTWVGYRYYVKAYINPRIGTLKVPRCTPWRLRRCDAWPQRCARSFESFWLPNQKLITAANSA